MSDDRLDQALEAMKQEEVDAGTVEAARARVWNHVAHTAGAGCAEFRPDIAAYLGGNLGASRRVLMEDHLGRCPACRVVMAEMKGDRKVIAMPRRAASRWTRWGTIAAAAAVLLVAAYIGRGTIDAMMAPGGPRATVVSTQGDLYRLAGGALAVGATIGEKETVRTGPGAHAVLRLADGSLVDINEGTEFFVATAWSGRTIHLQRGDVIVRAAKQRRGHLRVLTRDSIASVKGTVFAVSAGLGGSVVSVVEGAVAVNQPGTEVLLSPGEQAASNPALVSTVADAVSWSPDAAEYLELLGSLAKIERQLAEIAPGELRTSSSLLGYLPNGAYVYGAVPNLGGTIGQAMVLADQQASENATFGTWWNSETAQQMKQVIGHVQSVSAMLGDEVVFCAASQGRGHDRPIVLARVLPGRRAELATALQGLFTNADEVVPAFSVTDELMVISNTPASLEWALANLGQGFGSPFAAAIAQRYERGAGWLVAIDTAPVIAMAEGDDAPPIDLASATGLKYVFVEQRAPAGAEENELTLQFGETRKGMASWLANSGSGGAAEYLPADALMAGYVATREPWQLFKELTTLMSKQGESVEGDLAKAEDVLGEGFFDNLTKAMGTETAFALSGFSMNGPTWVMAALVNDASVIDGSIQKLADTFNAHLSAEEQDKRLIITRESANGHAWMTMKPANLPFGITWTYDGGYLVAGADRASAERAIATRNGGSPLVFSPTFVGQLPSSAGMHPAAFVWLNPKGAPGIVSLLAQNPELTKLLSGRDPVLVAFDGSAEQIHATSRTRLTGVIMDVMMLQGLGRTQQQPSETVQH